MKIKYAYIEITNICNLNCRSCYNRSGIPHERREFSLEQFSHVVNRLINEYGCERISLSGGEPTLHRHFEEILNLRLQYKDLHIGIVTNATTENLFLADIFNKNERVSIQISLDGSCEAVNSSTRGIGNFEKAVKFASSLDKSSKRPLLKMVVSQNNYNDVEAFYELARSLDCAPEFEFVHNMGNAYEEWQSLKLTAQQKLGILRTVNTLNKKYDMNANLPYCTSSCPLVNPDSEHSVLVKTDGSVYPCQMLYSDKYGSRKPADRRYRDNRNIFS